MGILSGYYQRWQASRRERNEARAEARIAMRNPPPQKHTNSIDPDGVIGRRKRS
jgi:hypothetical protein